MIKRLSCVLFVAGWLAELEFLKAYLKPGLGVAGTDYVPDYVIGILSSVGLGIFNSKSTAVLELSLCSLALWSQVSRLVRVLFGLIDLSTPILAEEHYLPIEQYVLHVLCFHLLLVISVLIVSKALNLSEGFPPPNKLGYCLGEAGLGVSVYVLLFKIAQLKLSYGSSLIALSAVAAKKALSKKQLAVFVVCSILSALVIMQRHNDWQKYGKVAAPSVNLGDGSSTILNGTFDLLFSDFSIEDGLVQVIEQHEPVKARFLRSDHSILGGTWTDFSGQSVFTAFYLSDFVKHIKRPRSSNSLLKRAFVLGLGVGTGPERILKSNITTHIVDIDRRVVLAAKGWFNFPDLAAISLDKHANVPVIFQRIQNTSHIIIADGLRVVKALAGHVQKYDFIVHDVFSGGMVSSPLIEEQVFINLKKMLLPDGVLVFNYVGRMKHATTLYLYQTLRLLFKNVRIYRDQQENTQRDSLQNIVFFCADFAIKFKLPKVNINKVDKKGPDYLYLETKRQFLSWEIDPLAIYTKQQIEAVRRPLSQLRDESHELALEHWKIMRSILPNSVWENYCF